GRLRDSRIDPARRDWRARHRVRVRPHRERDGPWARAAPRAARALRGEPRVRVSSGRPPGPEALPAVPAAAVSASPGLREMPQSSVLDAVCVVLFEPQDPINIGAVVRAMKNMGVHELRLVSPVEYEPNR